MNEARSSDQRFICKDGRFIINRAWLRKQDDPRAARKEAEKELPDVRRLHERLNNSTLGQRLLGFSGLGEETVVKDEG